MRPIAFRVLVVALLVGATVGLAAQPASATSCVHAYPRPTVHLSECVDDLPPPPPIPDTDPYCWYLAKVLWDVSGGNIWLHCE